MSIVTPLSGAAFTVMLSIIFAETLKLGVIGLGVAVAISTLVHTLILLFLMHKKTAIISAQFIIGVVKMMLATAIMGVFLWIPMRVIDRYILDTTRTLNLLLLTMSVLAIGILVYINLSSLMRIEQLSEVFALGRRIGNWRRALEESEEVLETTSEEKPTG